MWSIADKNFPMIIIIITSTRAQSTFHCSSGFFFLPSFGHCSFLHGSAPTEEFRLKDTLKLCLDGPRNVRLLPSTHTHTHTTQQVRQGAGRQAGRLGDQKFNITSAPETFAKVFRWHLCPTVEGEEVEEEEANSCGGGGWGPNVKGDTQSRFPHREWVQSKVELSACPSCSPNNSDCWGHSL